MLLKVLTSLNIAGLLFIAAYLSLKKDDKAEDVDVEEIVSEVVEESLPNSVDSTRLEQPSKPIKPFTTADVHNLLLARTNQKREIFIAGLRPELDSAGLVVVSVFHEVLGDSYTPLITSANDYAHHKKTSAHYRNMALDFRIKGMPMYKKQKIAKLSKERLGKRFFVQHEFPGGEMEHLHIELRDPARNWDY